MTARVSTVGNLKVLSINYSAILHMGDCVALTPRSEVLAVQRQVSNYLGDEGNWDSFQTFRQPIPEVLVDETVRLSIRNDSPWLAVGSMKIIGLAAAAVVQIGSNKLIDSENRTLHIRQLTRGIRPVGGTPAVVEGADD